jgi:hypothetical protein
MSIIPGQTVLASDMNSIVPIGVPLPFFGNASNLPADHLILDGSTIGDGSSGATARANADTQTLFTLLWNSIANAELTIQTSGGSPTTRGASATADFVAHKRMPLPDLRAYTLGGYKSGDANFGTLGKAVGEAIHTLTTTEIPSHHHGGLPSSTSTSYGGVSGGQSYYTPSSGNNTSDVGGGGAHNNIQPTFTVNWIIRYKYYA